MRVDVVILGAGAAGMMCAATAAARGRKVVLVDHARTLAEKIRISGGGRCNFTNLHARPENYLSANPHFCRSALARYTPQHFLALLARYGISYHEKKLGQLFCDEDSGRIIRMLKAECDVHGVHWHTGSAVRGVARETGEFVVHTETGSLRGNSLVIATGGLSIPKIGATPLAFQLAEQFGLRVVPPRPGLVPLMWDAADKERWGELAGVSQEVEAQAESGPAFRENLLFTHGGLSGPAILQVSSYWLPGQGITINWLPDLDAAAWLLDQRREKSLLATSLGSVMPKRLAERFSTLEGANAPSTASARSACGIWGGS